MNSLKPLVLEGPDEELARKIRVETGEDANRFANNLKILEDWMSHQNHLPQDYDKRMLPIFLRGCKHDMEKTKIKIEKYFAIKTGFPEMYANRDPCSDEMLKANEICYNSYIGQLSPEGYRISYHKVNGEISDFDCIVKKGSYTACIRTVLETLNAGDILVYDVGNLSASLAPKVMTPLFRRCVQYGAEMYPVRLSQIHVINVSPIFEKIVMLIKHLMRKEKQKQRIVAHLNHETLKDYIPLKWIPSDYGGLAPSMKELATRTDLLIKENREWFLENDKKVLQGPIPEKYSYILDDYGAGVEGSFRKLDID